MKTFSLTDLAHRSGEVAQAAYRAPVDITNRGKRAFVLIASDQFDALAKASGRRAVHASDLTGEEAADYIRGLEEAAKTPLDD